MARRCGVRCGIQKAVGNLGDIPRVRRAPTCSCSYGVDTVGEMTGQQPEKEQSESRRKYIRTFASQAVRLLPTPAQAPVPNRWANG